MRKRKTQSDIDMPAEYDFAGGTRGKHARHYQQGHSVTIHKANGIAKVQRYMPVETEVVKKAKGRSNGKKKIVQDKYRGTTIYAHVLAELVRAAQYRGLTTYQDIAVIMGLLSNGNKMGKETGHCVGEISEDEVIAGRPMLSALVVKSQGGKPTKPGPGFFTFAQELGRMNADDDDQEFWERERNAVYAAWRRPLPK